ncbi:hypothetical protein AB0A69_05035 [Streptomyces sp. NPDC045431]|uniref:hypothetical protein n=1 Tax=Streptomyces sp. NPDC045431 TaxID=3155613 RepID=UPI003402AB1B
MKTTPLTPYARLPRAYREMPVIAGTVDAYGRAHWLLGEAGGRTGEGPYDAVMVTVDEGRTEETVLSAVRPRRPMIDALPDGGFVLAAGRSRPDEQHVQVFDALGKPSWTFRVGDGIEHLLADEAGDLWVGYFDEGVYGDDPLSRPGLRRWSGTGEPQWAYAPPAGNQYIWDVYSLNVDGDAAWSTPYGAGPLLEVRGEEVRVRSAPVRMATALAVHGDQVVFLSGSGKPADLLTYGRLTDTSVEPLMERRLVRPDERDVGRCQTVCRGSRIFLRHASAVDWEVLDLAG